VVHFLRDCYLQVIQPKEMVCTRLDAIELKLVTVLSAGEYSPTPSTNGTRAEHGTIGSTGRFAKTFVRFSATTSPDQVQALGHTSVGSWMLTSGSTALMSSIAK